MLDISVWKEPELTRAVPVRPDGKISLPLLNDVQAAGKTPLQLATDITAGLKKYVTDPQVTVIVTTINSQRVYILGEVNRAGAYPLLPNMTVLQALSSAGGFTQFANLKKSTCFESKTESKRGPIELQGRTRRESGGSEYFCKGRRHDRRAVEERKLMRGTLKIRLAAVGAMILAATVARAQQQGTDQSAQPTQATQPSQAAQPSQPIPAYHSPLASGADNGNEAYDPQKLNPDTTPLTGIQDLSLGVPATTHSYWLPHLDFNSTVDTNPLAGQGNSGLTTFTSFFGGIDLHRDWGIRR